MDDYELVRVSRELVDQLVRDGSEPVVVVGIHRLDDGTCDMTFRRAASDLPRDEQLRLRTLVGTLTADGHLTTDDARSLLAGL